MWEGSKRALERHLLIEHADILKEHDPELLEFHIDIFGGNK
jgi:hypothetical protein